MKTEIEKAQKEIEELKMQLFEANCIIEAIKEGAIDALVVNKKGLPSIYALESSDFTYRMLIEKSGEGAISISPAGLILYCNECFANMVGLSVNQIIGTYFNSYIDSVGQFQKLKLALQTGPSKGEIVLNVDGRKLPVYASLSDLNPQVAAIGIIITDLTEKRNHEDMLAAYRQKLENQINEMKRTNFNLEQHIHVIKNDIKEPLRKISVYAASLIQNKNQKIPESELQKMRVIARAAERISSMISDVSRYALSVHRADTSEVDLNTIVKEVAEDMSLLIEERKVQLSYKQLPLIKGSAFQMHLLFLNLIDNALRMTHEGAQPKIKITTDIEDCVDMRHPNKKYYRIDLRDGRSGIVKRPSGKNPAPPPNFQLNGDYEHEGLSLAICKRIMENHAGKLELDDAHGSGNVFRLYFPLTG